MYQGIGNKFVNRTGKKSDLVSTWRSVHLDKAENIKITFKLSSILLLILLFFFN